MVSTSIKIRVAKQKKKTVSWFPLLRLEATLILRVQTSTASHGVRGIWVIFRRSTLILQAMRISPFWRHVYKSQISLDAQS